MSPEIRKPELTGNREYAERAGRLVMQDLGSGWWTTIWGIHDPGWKAVEGMYAYDLIHDGKRLNLAGT